jgi:hypothetical protein
MDLMSTAELLGSFGEFVGAIAVVATLFYLARQIRQSTEVSRTTSYHQALEQGLTAALQPDFSELLSRVEAGEELRDAEHARYMFLVHAWIYTMENLMHLHSKGQIDNEMWENTIANNFGLFELQSVFGQAESRPGPLSKKLVALVTSRFVTQGKAPPTSA